MPSHESASSSQGVSRREVVGHVRRRILQRQWRARILKCEVIVRKIILPQSLVVGLRGSRKGSAARPPSYQFRRKSQGGSAGKPPDFSQGAPPALTSRSGKPLRPAATVGRPSTTRFSPMPAQLWDRRGPLHRCCGPGAGNRIRTVPDTRAHCPERRTAPLAGLRDRRIWESKNHPGHRKCGRARRVGRFRL